jgi:hypothetical protein
VKADRHPTRRHIIIEGKTPDMDVPYGIASSDAPIKFLIRLRIEVNKDDACIPFPVSSYAAFSEEAVDASLSISIKTILFGYKLHSREK